MALKLVQSSTAMPMNHFEYSKEILNECWVRARAVEESCAIDKQQSICSRLLAWKSLPIPVPKMSVYHATKRTYACRCLSVCEGFSTIWSSFTSSSSVCSRHILYAHTWSGFNQNLKTTSNWWVLLFWKLIPLLMTRPCSDICFIHGCV